jgi:RNA polymerase sigma factor (sigma-70 family)
MRLHPALQYSHRSSVYTVEERVVSSQAMTLDDNQHISDAIQRDQPKLRNFIRSRVPDSRDAEDILQDIYYELAEATRLLMPIEHLTAWLYRVARNRIIDLVRKKDAQSFSDLELANQEDEIRELEDLLPSPEAGPDAQFARNLLVDELEMALDELPVEQQEVFVAHELEGRSFKEIAAETGENINTLLARKHYAVLFLRKRLQKIYDDFKKG